jgi:hypothetical protein
MSAPPPSVGRVRGNVHDAISFSCRPRRRGGNRHENHAAVAFEKTKPRPGPSPVMTTFIPIPRVFVGQTMRPSATISYAAPQL